MSQSAVFTVEPPSRQPRQPRQPRATTAPDTWRLAWHERLARSLLHARMAGLRGGSLRLVAPDGTTLVGDGPAITVTIHEPGFYAEIVFGGTIGVGEAFAHGLWTCPDVPRLIALFAANRELVDAMDSRWSLVTAPLKHAFHRWHRNTRSGARANIAAHYDLGNNFFARWLDPTMSYSSYRYATAETTMEAAAVAKLDQVCQRLALRPGMHLVEIGTGWGGLAIHAARHYGVRVTTTTISRAQHDEARTRIAAAGLADRITLLCEDYRDLPTLIGRGGADRLVSIEMVEAIGVTQYRQYFSTIAALLKPDGLSLIQAITIPEHRFAGAARNVDFIQRHIFPGCAIPSLGRLIEAAGVARLDLVASEDFARDYERTLLDWLARFTAARTDLRGLGHNGTFLRLWEFYLAYCAGGFRTRAIGVSHLVFAGSQWNTASPATHDESIHACPA